MSDQNISDSRANENNAPPELSLVVPCYNEEAHLEKSIATIIELLDAFKITFEIILIDDKSLDRTREAVERVCASERRCRGMFHERNTGRGRTVADGILAARGEWAGFLDVDLEIPAIFILPILLELRRGADVATVCRYYNISLLSLYRWMITSGYRRLVRFRLGLPYLDTEAGCKFFRREKILPLLPLAGDPHWFWDTEIMYVCRRAGLKVVEIPAVFIKNPKKKSTVRVLRDSVYYLKKILFFSRAQYEKAGAGR